MSLKGKATEDEILTHWSIAPTQSSRMIDRYQEEPRPGVKRRGFDPAETIVV